MICLWWFFEEDILVKSTWMILLSLGAIYLMWKVWPFTWFGEKMIRKVPFQPQKGIHLIVGNVYQYNKSFAKTLNLLLKRSPDVIFLVETDQAWIENLSELEKSYPHRLLLPLENTYGLAFYSKLPILRQEINYLIDEKIPSIEVDLRLHDGSEITLFGIHPTPPVPGENLQSTDRDAEILMVGKKAKNHPKPSLVIGDLNDVAWSYTTRLFLKISGMADPRRGRGFYSTFHAKIPIFRWPLDHVFLSHHFGLSSMRVLPGIGSDHFPIELKATLTQSKTVEKEKASGQDLIEARAKIINGLKNEKPD